MAEDVRTWLADAERVPGAKEQLNDLKKAEQWFKEAQADLRAERFRPIADKARADLGAAPPEQQRRTGRRAADGHAPRSVEWRSTSRWTASKGAALGVMSQGELNALALSLFMPRASLPESPFRFMVIDDPVQSMDPVAHRRPRAGAAATPRRRARSSSSRTTSACRPRRSYLGLPATVIEVTRKPASKVATRNALTPVDGYLSDGHAVVKTPEMPDFVKRRVVPGLCRSAIEAACMHCVRVRRLKRGESHEAIEELLLDQKGLTKLAALALFDDEERGGEVTGSLKNRWKSGAVDAFKACNAGAHDGYDGDLEDLLRQTKLLARGIQELP